MKKINFAVFSIFLVVFIDNFGYSLIFNLLGPLLLRPEYGMISQGVPLHVKNIMLACIFGIFPLAQFFAAPIIGEIADIYGRKKTFYLSLLGMTVGFVFSAWSIFIKSVWLLLFSRLITGLFAGNISICMASIADISNDGKERGKNFSMVTAIFGISWILAMIIGGYIGNPNVLGNDGPGYVFLFTAAIALLTFFAILVFYRETYFKPAEIKFSLIRGISNINEVLKLKETRVYFLSYLFWSIGWVMTVQWFPSYSIEVFNVSVDLFTTWYLIMGIFWTAGAFFAKYYLFPKFNVLVVGLIGFSCMTVSLILMQFMPYFFLFGCFFAIGSFFAVFAMSSSLSLISLNADRSVQGKVMGLSQSVQSLAFVLVACIAFLVSLYTISVLFYFSALISLFGTIILFYKNFSSGNKSVE